MAQKLKILLNKSNPKIYRTVLVPENFTFHDLHIVIQIVMGLEGYHLYQFNLGAFYNSLEIALLNDRADFSLFGSEYERYDSTTTPITTVIEMDKKNVNYVYDFGDDWKHTITFLKETKEEVSIPVCIQGEGPNLMEDCGGIFGLYELMEISTKKRKTPEEKERLRWAGIERGRTYEETHAFDIDKVNQLLKMYFENKAK